MIEIVDKSQCCGCHGCVNVCPKSCISMHTDEEGFWYPRVDKDLCIDCQLCERVCPVLQDVQKEEFQPIAYACKNLNEEVREQSSSGGVFSLLCEDVISQGGVVFGASFDEHFNVRHTYAEKLEDCTQFRGSKYVQSKIGDTYKKAKQFLLNNRYVLFTGTPCQIKGLQMYLGKSYEKLIAVDVVCHGVPSPKVFSLYKSQLESQYDSKLSNVWFRRKDKGWNDFSFAARFENGTEYQKTLREDVFMRGFLSDLYLRPSCHECCAKNFSNNSDLSLADYWGVGRIHPDFDDDRGVSLLLVNSEKGSKMMSCVSSQLDSRETDIDYAITRNPAIVRPSMAHPKRQQFFDQLNQNPKHLSRLILKMITPPLLKRVKHETRVALWKIKQKLLNRL